jgi:hypothetical protein
MTRDSYRKTLADARRDLEDLYRQREEIERKIARLRQTIISLGALTKETENLEKAKRWFKENETLSEAVMNVIQASEVPVHPKDIQEALEDLGFDIGSSNPLASVWSVVRRLEQKKWGKHPYLRWYKREKSRKWGRGTRVDAKVGVWWGDHRPSREWEPYEMKSGISRAHENRLQEIADKDPELKKLLRRRRRKATAETK